MKTSSHGTGTVRPISAGEWSLEYQPKWASQMLSRTVAASTEQSAEKLLQYWVSELDAITLRPPEKQTKKRTYGTGSFYQLPSGKFLLRYKGETKTVDAANDKQAERALSNWVEETDTGTTTGPKISMNHLFDLFLADHRKKKRVETPIVEKKIDKYLRPSIGSLDAKKFGKDELEAYLDSRLRNVHAKTGRPPENATLNREVSIISRAMRLAVERLQRIVIFEKLTENPPRQGTTDEDLYQGILRELPDHVKPLWCFAYYTGVRSGQLKKLRWEWLDWEEWVMRAPGYYGKERITQNGQMHVIPIYLEMREFVKMMYAVRNPECPYLFQRDGGRIRSFRTAFENARSRVRLSTLLPNALRSRIGDLNQGQIIAFNSVPDTEVSGLFERALNEKLTAEQIQEAISDRAARPVDLVLFHDQRRTAVTNMIREGVPDHEAMAVSGHLDPSMLRRYAITKERDVQRVARRMTERFLRQRQAVAPAESEGFCSELSSELPPSHPGIASLVSSKLRQ